MRNSFEPHSQNPYAYGHGGDNMSSMDIYLERVTRIQHMPSIVSDYHDYPNVHETFNNHHQTTQFNHPQKMNPHMFYHQHQAPEPVHKKVHFVEHEKITEIDEDGRKHKVHEDKTIDVEADGFIQQRHKNFELSKWDTFKVY